MIEKVAARIIWKWMKKGNMARAMRDILPHSGLSFDEREEVARIVHDVVRYKLYYDYIMEKRRMKKSAENYVKLSLKKPKMDAPYHIRHSLSPKLAEVTPKEFIEVINREPDTVLCVNLSKIERRRAIEGLRKEGIEAEEFIPESAIKASSNARYSSLIKNGLAIVQDSSSQIVAKVAGSLGEEVLDYCAGSGGKSLAMYALNPNLKIHAYDINERKLKALENRAKKWEVDVHIFYDKPSGKFPVVLVDAPCSGVGAAARNPEAKYQENFEKFARMQLEILNKAKSNVKSDGYLVYVVCSYTPGETEEVIKEFLNKNPEFRAQEIKCGYEEHIKMSNYGAYILSGDIFYISILKRE